MSYAQTLRQNRADLRVKMASATSLKAQMKKADKSGAQVTVILAQQELEDDTVSLKDMHNGEQRTVSRDWLMQADNLRP